MINIVIPSYNSKKTIIRCLGSVLNQSYKKPYKVIVVDSSDDGTEKLIKRYFPKIHLVHLEKKILPGTARNIGVIESDSEFIGFTDADCIVDHFWIERILNRISGNKYDAVGGSIINGTTESITGTMGYFNEFSSFMPAMKSGLVTATATANVCYKRRIFRHQKFIDTSFAGEDTIFHWTLIENGGNLYFDPEIKVTHINKTGLSNVLRHQFRIGKGAGYARLAMKKDIVFIRFPVLSLIILPLIRFFRMNKRILLYDGKIWKQIICYLPLFFSISFSWCLGFYFSLKQNQ